MPDRRFIPKRRPTGNRPQVALLLVMAVLLLGSLLMLVPATERITRGLSLRGGTTVLMQAERPGGGSVSEDDMLAAKAIMDERLDLIKQSEVTVQIVGRDQFLLQIPDNVDANYILSVVGTAGEVEFIDSETAEDQSLVSSINNSQTVSLAYLKALGFLSAVPDAPPSATLFTSDDQVVYGVSDDETYYLPIEMYYNPMTDAQLPIASIRSTGNWSPARFESGEYTALMSGDDVETAKAQVNNNGYSSDYTVLITVSDENYELISASERDLIGGKLVLISIDGFATSAHITASDASNNQLTISGGLTDVTSVALSVVLETGAMPVTLSVKSTSSGSFIGQDMVSRTLMLLAIGFVVFLLYLLVYYRGLGLTAALGMTVFALLNLGVLALLSFYGFFVLTIPAVAAVALSCVVAADSILLIIERIREEITLGRPPRTSTTNALGSAERGSIDSSIILLLVGLLVLVIDSGSLRPFGVALAVGTACSLLVTVFFTSPALKLLSYELFASNPGLWGVNEPAGKASTTDESN